MIGPHPRVGAWSKSVHIDSQEHQLNFLFQRANCQPSDGVIQAGSPGKNIINQLYPWMDPISVAASVLTVLGAAGTAVRALDRLQSSRQAPEHLVALLNEVSFCYATLLGEITIIDTFP